MYIVIAKKVCWKIAGNNKYFCSPRPLGSKNKKTNLNILRVKKSNNKDVLVYNNFIYYDKDFL